MIGPTDVLPAVISGPSNQSVDEGTRVSFSCEVVGSPEPSISWFQQDDVLPLQNTPVIVITQSGQTSHLSLINVTLADQGTYKCVAASSIGTDSKEAGLAVKSKFLLQCRNKGNSFSNFSFKIINPIFL